MKSCDLSVKITLVNTFFSKLCGFSKNRTNTQKVKTIFSKKYDYYFFIVFAIFFSTNRMNFLKNTNTLYENFKVINSFLKQEWTLEISTF